MELKEKSILEIASRHFSFFGYRKTSLDDIVREARISKSTLYKYFKSKDALFKKFAEIEFHNMHKRHRDSLEPIKNPEKKLMAYPMKKRSIILDRMQAVGSSFSILEEIRDVAVNQLQPVRGEEMELIKEILFHGAEQKLFKDSQIEEKAEVIMEIFHHFEPTWWQMDDKAAEHSIERLFNFLLEGIRC